MSAICVAESTAGVVVVRKEESSVTCVPCVFAERMVDRGESAPQVVDRHRALTTQVGLQIGHQQGAGHSLARDISQYQRQVAFAELQKIVVAPHPLPELGCSRRYTQASSSPVIFAERAALAPLGQFPFHGPLGDPLPSAPPSFRQDVCSLE